MRTLRLILLALALVASLDDMTGTCDTDADCFAKHGH
jgi:hypothetical protein